MQFASPLLTLSCGTLVIHYPKFSEHLQKGALVRAFTTVMDLAPTFLEMAGIDHPAADGKDGMFRGRQVAPMSGKSWLKFMSSDKSDATAPDAIHDGDSYMGWELFGRGAIRQGSWKLVHIESAAGGGKWQLYDLSRDPGETEDLATQEPEKVKDLLKLWDDYVKKSGVLWTPHEDIEVTGDEWGGNKADLIGGDHISQAVAWIQARPGEETPRGQVTRGG